MPLRLRAVVHELRAADPQLAVVPSGIQRRWRARIQSAFQRDEQLEVAVLARHGVVVEQSLINAVADWLLFAGRRSERDGDQNTVYCLTPCHRSTSCTHRIQLRALVLAERAGPVASTCSRARSTGPSFRMIDGPA